MKLLLSQADIFSPLTVDLTILFNYRDLMALPGVQSAAVEQRI